MTNKIFRGVKFSRIFL